MTSGQLGGDVTAMCEGAVAEVAGSVGYFHGSSIVRLPSGDTCAAPPPLRRHCLGDPFPGAV